MTPDQEGELCRRLWRIMGDWEREHATGSARPPFEAAFRGLLGELGISATQLEREAIWQKWLRAGKPIFPEPEGA